MDQVMAVDAQAIPGKGLSQMERVVDTFVAPSATFTDILRSTTWWLPFLLILIITAASAFAIDKKIGFDHVAEHTMQQNPKAAEKLADLSPQQRAMQMSIATVFTKDLSYAGGVFFLLVAALVALIMWASLNFGLGARTTFAQNFAVFMYAYLPHLFLGLLNIIFVYAGVNTENFDINNPVGTNIGYYMTGSAQWVKTALSYIDVFGLWSLALLVIGSAIIARKSKGQVAMVVVGWWVIMILVTAGLAAAIRLKQLAESRVRVRPPAYAAAEGHILEGKPIPVYGDGSTRRDYTYVGDIVDGVVSAIAYNRSNYEVVNLGCGIPIRLMDMIRELETALGLRAVLSHLPEQPGDVPQTYASIAKARRLFSYQPKTTLPEGLRQFAHSLEIGAVASS